MAYYYVTHPNMNFSATIEAPSTEKARTTYLDYLERQGMLSRSRRQELRRNMVADRVMDPGEVQADISLSYGYEETRFAPVEREELQLGDRMVEIPIEPRREPVYEEEPEEYLGPVEREQPVERPEEPRVFSPIQQISLGGYR